MIQSFIMALSLCIILILLNSVISKQSIYDREKTSPFECGFDPKSKARLPFSLRFYLIAVIFLIFDVEITLILPIPLIAPSLQTSAPVYLTLFFILILLVGLFHEWKEGALNWKN